MTDNVDPLKPVFDRMARTAMVMDKTIEMIEAFFANNKATLGFRPPAYRPTMLQGGLNFEYSCDYATGGGSTLGRRFRIDIALQSRNGAGVVHISPKVQGTEDVAFFTAGESVEEDAVTAFLSFVATNPKVLGPMLAPEAGSQRRPSVI